MLHFHYHASVMDDIGGQAPYTCKLGKVYAWQISIRFAVGVTPNT